MPGTRPLLFALGLAALAAGAARADYVADEHEIAAMKARILKNPPTAAILSAEPYPGAKLDADCSADQSATNQSDPMVYCLYTRDSEDQVKAFLAGAGKPVDGVFAVVSRDNVVNAKGYVVVADVTQIRYFVSEKRKAEARQKAAAQAAAPAAPAAASAAAPAAEAAPATAGAAPAGSTADAPAAEPPGKKKKKKKDAAATASEAADTVNALKGLFGH